MASSFFTVSKHGVAVHKDRGSKFIGLVFPIDNESVVRSILEAVKKEHPGAVHYCYAWRVGPMGEHYRSNDDGEPSGSAGKPILGQLLAHGVTHTLVIVVRYFGGTLLGVGGLISAYKTAASEAITAAGKEEQHVMITYKVSFASEDTSAVMRVLKEFDAKIGSNTYDTESHVCFSIKEMHRNDLETKFNELYRVKLSLSH